MTNEELIAKFRYALDNHWGYIWGATGILWTAARQKQKVNYMISNFGADWKKNADAKDSNYYYTALYGEKWIGHYVSDCAGLFVWAFKQYGLKMSTVASYIYASYCSRKGALNSDLKKTLVPGTAVFTGDTAAKHPHVGLYVGNGKIIEAHGTQAGVCTANITETRWKWWGELKNVSYPAQNEQKPASAPAEDKTSADARPTLRQGMKGDYVKQLQKRLIELGYSVGSAGADGDFGSGTLAAVKKFQKAAGLTQDGVVGAKTWAALDSAKPKEATYKVTITGLTKAKAEEIVKKYGGKMAAEAK